MSQEMFQFCREVAPVAPDSLLPASQDQADPETHLAGFTPDLSPELNYSHSGRIWP